MQNQVQSLSEKLQALQQETSTKINEQKALIQTKERELDDVANAYDRDRALHEQRIGFADTQKMHAKQELQDLQKKFNNLLEMYRRLQDKDKVEDADKSKYNKDQQIKDLQDDFQKKDALYQDRIFKLQKQLKELSDEQLLQSQGQRGSIQQNEIRLFQLMDSEKKLQSELEALKKEREQSALLQQQFLDAEREKHLIKYAQLEQQKREAEQKRQQMFFEHEKQRAQWA